MTTRILVQDYSQLDDLITELSFGAEIPIEEHSTWVIDTETNGLRPYHGDRIWGISLYSPALDISWYVPLRYQNEWNIGERSKDRLLYLISRQKRLIFFNAKFDLHMLYADNMPEPKVAEDVMIAAQLLNENEWLSNGGKVGAYQLKRLAAKYLGADAVAGEEDLIAKAKALGVNPKTEMWKMPAKDVAFYAMMDVEITWQLLQKYMEGLERWGQVELYKQRSDFQLKSLMRMERNGMTVDVDLIKEHRATLEPAIAEMQKKFDDFLKARGMRLQSSDKKGLETRWINLNSPTHLVLLFKIAGYNVEASNKYVLRNMVNEGSQLAKDIVLYRQYAMADQMYYQPYLEHVTDTGIIHHSLNTTGTKTGRLSSSNPNFQQIPKDGEKYLVKLVFVPRKGYVMVQFDYKALEFRLAAHFAKDENIRAAFLTGLDPHQDTANRLGLTRSRAKTLNFGLLYGMGGQKLSDQYGIPLKEANEQAKAWHSLYSSFRKTMKKAEDLAKVWRNPDGTLGGKFQYIRLINNKVKHFNEYLAYPEYTPDYRSAFNFIVQGTAAIVAEESIQRVNMLLPDNDIWKPTNAVHDALMGEIRRDKVNEVVPIIIKAMEDWPMFNPALAVEPQISDTSWYDMKDYKAEEWV